MDQVKLCTFTKPDGASCGSPAKGESDFCYHHQEHRRRRRKLHNTFMGKMKVLEPYMSGAAAGKDPVTHRVYDALFADAVDDLDLPPFEPLDNPVNVALTNILQLVATQQVDPRITQQMLYTVRLAVANQSNLIKEKEVLAHGGRAPRQSEDETLATDHTDVTGSPENGKPQTENPFTTKDTKEHDGEPGYSTPSGVRHGDALEAASAAGESQPRTEDFPTTKDTKHHEGEPGYSTPSGVRHGDALETASAAGDEQPQMLTADDTDHGDQDEARVEQDFSPALGVATSPLHSAEGQREDEVAALEQEADDEVAANNDPVAEQALDPCESVESVAETVLADDQQPNHQQPHRGGYVHKDSAWHEKKAREADEYQQKQYERYLAKEIPKQDKLSETRERKKQISAIVKGEFGKTGTGE